jgi:CheY-like chemotaxis protein
MPIETTWQVIHVEDDPDTLRQVKDYLEGERFDFGVFRLVGTGDFGEAIGLLKERRVDLLLLDVFRGDPGAGESAGTEVLTQWRATGFAPVILYTALPEAVTSEAGPFVRVVPKEAGGLRQLRDVVTEIFGTRIPQIHRAVVDHLDYALRDYMWDFVEAHWSEIEGLTEQPDFIRLLLTRLGLHFTRDASRLVNALYPGAIASEPAPHTVHPVEYYVRPPIGPDPRLGDLRRVAIAGDEDVLVLVLWPSCDLVQRDRGSKVERALCARVKPLSAFPELQDWIAESSPGKRLRDPLVALINNNRRTGQAERYHFLPGAWEMPALVIDFGELEHLAVETLTAGRCEATVASPFAESISSRLLRYLGRLGTPDLDTDIVLDSLRQGVVR